MMGAMKSEQDLCAEFRAIMAETKSLLREMEDDLLDHPSDEYAKALCTLIAGNVGIMASIAGQVEIARRFNKETINAE